MAGAGRWCAETAGGGADGFVGGSDDVRQHGRLMKGRMKGGKPPAHEPTGSLLPPALSSTGVWRRGGRRAGRFGVQGALSVWGSSRPGPLLHKFVEEREKRAELSLHEPAVARQHGAQAQVARGSRKIVFTIFLAGDGRKMRGGNVAGGGADHCTRGRMRSPKGRTGARCAPVAGE
jgi:hypothetical protein